MDLPDTEPFFINTKPANWANDMPLGCNVYFSISSFVALAEVVEKCGSIQQLTDSLGTDKISLEDYLRLRGPIEHLIEWGAEDNEDHPLGQLVSKWNQGNYRTPAHTPNLDVLISHLSLLESVVEKYKEKQSFDSITIEEIAALQSGVRLQDTIDFADEEQTNIPQLQILKETSVMRETIDVFSRQISSEEYNGFLQKRDASESPFLQLQEKIKNIIKYSDQENIEKLPSSQKLTFFELLFLQKKLDEKLELSARMREQCNTFRELILTHSSDEVSLLSAHKIDTNDPTWLGKLRVKTFALFEKYHHAGILLSHEQEDEKLLQATSLWTEEVHHKTVSRRRLDIDDFAINIDALMPKGLEGEDQADFKATFLKNLDKLAYTEYADLELANLDAVSQLKRYFGKKTKKPTRPEDIRIETKRELVCIEFVVFLIIQATMDTYNEMDLPPPDSLRFFGFHSKEDLTSLSIERSIKALRKKGILVPQKPFQFILK